MQFARIHINNNTGSHVLCVAALKVELNSGDKVSDSI